MPCMKPFSIGKPRSLIVSASLHILPAQLLLCVSHLVLLIGACCACAVFGVWADDDFPKNESTHVLFLYMYVAHFIEG